MGCRRKKSAERAPSFRVTLPPQKHPAQGAEGVASAEAFELATGELTNEVNTEAASTHAEEPNGAAETGDEFFFLWPAIEAFEGELVLNQYLRCFEPW